MCHHILKKTPNGDRIVAKKLDECVTANKLDTTDPDYKLQIDFSCLSGQEGSTNSDMIKDILSIRHIAAEKLLLHPVLTTFIDIKWKNTKKYFFLNFLIYIIFLLTFSLFLANMFYRPLRTRTTIVIPDIVFPNNENNDGIVFTFKPKQSPVSSNTLNANKNIVFDLNQNRFLGNVSNRIDGEENQLLG